MGGNMYIFSQQFFSDLSQLLGGPAHFRYILQPVIAVALGVRDGRLDAKAGTPPYFLKLITSSRGQRREILRQGFNSITSPFLFAIALDMLVQFMILREVHLLAALLTGVILIALPYLVTRGLANKATTRKGRIHPASI